MRMIPVVLFAWVAASAQTIDCLPRPVGSGTALHVSQRDGMTALVWWCDKVTHWAPQTVVGTMGVTQMAQAATSLSAADDPLGFAREMLEASSSPLSEALAAFRIEAYWDHAHHKPADPVFVVAANAGRPTRPAYAVADGVRTTRQDGTAQVGSTCACRRQAFIEGRTVYCAFDTTPRVAVCSRQP